jgi:hypothetical protein
VVSLLLTIPFLVAFIGIPLWMTFAHPDTLTDHTDAHQYLRTRRAPAPAPAHATAPAPAMA